MSKTNKAPASAANNAVVAPDEDGLVSAAYGLFEEFRQAYTEEWQRLDECERLYRGDHWDSMSTEGSTDEDDAEEPKPVTPTIHSTVESIAGDLMDRYPQAIVQPETPDDEQIAQVVGALIKQNHDAADYRTEYSKLCHDLLVDGYCVQEVGYDVTANRGIGAAYIRYVDSRNILFDPQADNVQDSRGVFKIQSKPLEWLKRRYPDKADSFSSDGYEIVEDSVIRLDQSKSVLLIEYWWREFVPDGDGTGRWVVHMAKLAGHTLLEDSRTAKPDGYFSCGEYPFVVTPLFRRKGSALGWGIADIFGDEQRYSDRLDQITLRNASLASHNKLLMAEMSGLDADDLRDWRKEVHIGQRVDDSVLRWMGTPPLPQYIVGLAGEIRNYIKEESGANDVSRGNIGGGVTSAAAISALQDMSSKRSRVISSLMHEAFRKVVRYEIDVEREYNTLPREVYYTDRSGQKQTATFESALLSRQSALGNDVPIEFFVSVKAQQENRWSQQANNDLMLQLVQLQIISPPQALQLLQFEGKEDVLALISGGQDQAAMQQEAMQMQAMQEQAALEQQMAQLPQPTEALA